jgi:hypothetical protein
MARVITVSAALDSKRPFAFVSAGLFLLLSTIRTRAAFQALARPVCSNASTTDSETSSSGKMRNPSHPPLFAKFFLEQGLKSVNYTRHRSNRARRARPCARDKRPCLQAWRNCGGAATAMVRGRHDRTSKSVLRAGDRPDFGRLSSSMLRA